MRKLRAATAAALIAGGVILLAAGCGDDSSAAKDGNSLQVGYASVAAPWRVGAKPGQVGTNALPARDQLLLRAIGRLLPLLSMPELDPVAHLEGTTDWLLDMLAERVRLAQPGRYASLFEPSHGLEQPPVMKALVVQRGDTKIAIVRADLYLAHEQIQRRVAALIEAETGIDRDHLFLVATHNHSGPHAVSPSPGVWILADAFDPRHFVYATRAMAAAVIEADRALQPATLRTSVREFRAVQRNIIGPGQISFANPDGVAETIPVGYPTDYFDPDLVSLRFDAPDGGQPIAYLFLFGMHPESLPGGHGILSGDWPTHVERKLEERTGAPAIWLPGPLGDSEPDAGLNHPEHRFFRAGFDAMETMSEIIADHAEAAFLATGAAPASTTPRVEQAVADLPGIEGFPVPTTAYLGPRLPVVRVLHDSATVRLHAIRLGDVLLLGSPAEVTTDLAFNIKSRVDRQAGNVYQGYEWPQAPEWVKQRVRRNFTNDEIDPALGAPIPVIVSHVNGYMGYIVSAWEYENRVHYRQEMTALGAGTADHVAGGFVGLARQLEGGPRYQPALPPWHELDLAGVAQVQQFLAGLDESVVAMARALPASDAQRVGTTLAEPPAEVGVGDTVDFSWVGGTNDMEPPRLSIERQGEGGWQVVGAGPSRELWLLFEAPDRWTAQWRGVSGQSGDRLRLRVAGSYRGTVAGTATPDPIWDPDGKNAPYEAMSREYVIR